jgi:hypothetical protein
MSKPGKLEQIVSQFVNELNDDELDLLANKLSAARERRTTPITLEQITPEQMRDPEFKRAVFSAIERATKQLR